MLEQVKNFTNTDSEDFVGKFAGEDIPVREGETKAFPESIANHIAGQLATKILIREKKNYLTDPRRAILLNEMLGQVMAPPEPAEEAKAEAVKKVDLNSLNIKELRALAVERGVKTKGKKADLIKALKKSSGAEFEGVKE